MDNILYKVSFPAEFHAQTAAEAALKLNIQLSNKLEEIDKIIIETQEPGMRIISKEGPNGQQTFRIRSDQNHKKRRP